MEEINLNAKLNTIKIKLNSYNNMNIFRNDMKTIFNNHYQKFAIIYDIIINYTFDYIYEITEIKFGDYLFNHINIDDLTEYKHEFIDLMNNLNIDININNE